MEATVNMNMAEMGARQFPESTASPLHTSPTSSTQTNALLQIDATTFRENFNRQPFLIHHQLEHHELFALPRLIELAQYLPVEQVEYNSGKLPVNQDPTLTPRNGLSIADTIQRIEECESWMVLKNVERHPAYRELLDQCLNQVQEHSEALAPQMTRREAYIFITSPNSVTPYHIDNEYNFLLQIRGNKFVNQFDRADRSIISELELENFYAGGHRNLVFKEEYQAKAKVFELQPGDGLHFPITAPHWIKNGASVSISFSITFRNPASEACDMVYRVNTKLRKIGLTPTPFGQSSWRDQTKTTSFRLWRKFFATH